MIPVSTPYVSFPHLGKLGRLGNQLFQIAATIGIAIRHRANYRLPRWSYSRFLANPPPQSPQPLDVISYVEPSFNYRAVNISHSIALIGYFQSEQYFAHCAPAIRHLLTIAPNVHTALDHHYPHITRAKSCSIHVRRTDYLNNAHLCDLSSSDYYERAISLFDNDTSFYVFSDDILFCRTRFTGPQYVFIEGLSDIADMTLMSRCGSHIIANSTFSWWGAWLNPSASKKVVAPKDWFRGEWADADKPFGRLYHGYRDTKDLIPDRWIRL
jgi:hypothetical protein